MLPLVDEEELAGTEENFNVTAPGGGLVFDFDRARGAGAARGMETL